MLLGAAGWVTLHIMLVTIPDLRSLESYGANLRRIYTYWLSKRGGRTMPRRADLDPTEIPPHLLPGITLVDVVADPRRYVYRLVGTKEAEVRGYDPTGKSVGEAFFGENAEDATECYDRVVETRAPVLDPVPFLERRRGYRGAESMFLPLSNDGIAVNMILVFFDPEAVVRFTGSK
ncbi:PAS domain-containing protein [Dongia sp.]|uniref:PAS domain-containing protein n=1 Tax=Dongia sp. TaxID=1977262 RepID=UPI003752CA2B